MLRKTLGFVGLVSLFTASLFGQGLTTNAAKGHWEEINFAFDRAILTDGYPSLLRLAELLQQHSDYKVTLEGHADHRGPDDYNIRLGRQRGEMVRDFLIKYGVSQSQITVETYGEKQPASSSIPETDSTNAPPMGLDPSTRGAIDRAPSSHRRNESWRKR